MLLPILIVLVSGSVTVKANTREKESVGIPYIEVPANKYYGALVGEMDVFEAVSLNVNSGIIEGDNIIVAMYSATPTTYFTFNSDTQTIITYSSSTEAPKEVVIPAQIGGYDVLHIASYAFAGFQLTGVEFEEGSKLQTIGTYAFYNNLNLK